MKVIHFDECFTTTVGNKSEDIKPGSLCGRYLNDHPISDEEMMALIKEHNLKPSLTESAFKNKTCYEPGTLLMRDGFLLMSFAKLNKNGRGEMTRDDYINCLNVLWKEIDKYHGETSVVIPVFGSNITHFEDSMLTQQELLDIIIASYKMNSRKINKPSRLIITCSKKDGFSLNKIGSFI